MFLRILKNGDKKAADLGWLLSFKMKTMKWIWLLLFVSCAKAPCVVAVDVTINNGTEITATAAKKVKCGDYISFPFSNAATKTNVRFIEINFFQEARVVMADVVFDFDFVEGIYKREYTFSDTNPNLMTWKVYEYNRAGYVQYETLIK